MLDYNVEHFAAKDVNMSHVTKNWTLSLNGA